MGGVSGPVLFGAVFGYGGAVSRDLTSGMQTAVAASVVRPVVFIEGEFESGTLRLWSGVGVISWNSQTWTGAGNLLSISKIDETADLRAAGITIGLAGMPTNISLVLSQARRNKAVRVWFGAMDAAGAVLADPYLAFEGRLDVPTIDDSGDTCTINIAYEGELIDLERPRVRRYTHEDQQLRAPGDRFFEYVPAIQNQALEW
jgi:hypothetical protein